MERVHIQRLWQVAEDLFDVQQKPLQAFLVLHVLLLHRPLDQPAQPVLPSSTKRHRYVTDAIFGPAQTDAASEVDASQRISSSSSVQQPPPHDLSRPALPPYLKLEEALTRVRAAEMLLCPPTLTTRAPITSSRVGMNEALSKRASQEALTLAEQVLAPLLPDNRGQAQATSRLGESEETDVAGTGTTTSASVAARSARYAAADYYFSTSSVVGLAWPAEPFCLSLPPEVRAWGRRGGRAHDEHRDGGGDDAIQVGPSLSLSVMPVSVVVRASLLGAVIARRTRRFRKALFLLHTAEAWVAHAFFGASSSEEAPVEGEGRAAFPHHVHVLCLDLVNRLDDVNAHRLVNCLVRGEAAADISSQDLHNRDSPAFIALCAVIARWMTCEHRCCVRLLRAELCRVYHAMILNVHASQLLLVQQHSAVSGRDGGHLASPYASTSTTTASGQTASAAEASRGSHDAPLQGLTSASMRVVSSSTALMRPAGNAKTAAQHARRATVATLDLRTRMKEYGDYLAQLLRCAEPQPPLLGAPFKYDDEEVRHATCLVHAWSSVLRDSFICGEFMMLRKEPQETSTEHARDEEKEESRKTGADAYVSIHHTPLEEATDVVLLHFKALAIVLGEYYASTVGSAIHPASHSLSSFSFSLARATEDENAPGPASPRDDVKTSQEQLSLLFEHALQRSRSPPHVTRKRPRASAIDEAEFIEGDEASPEPIASEYELLYQILLLGFDGSVARWQAWQHDQDGRHAESAPRLPHTPHWVSAGVRRALELLLHLYATVHGALSDAEAPLHEDGAPAKEAVRAWPLWSFSSRVEQRLRELLRCVDHVMLSLSRRDEPASSPSSSSSSVPSRGIPLTTMATPRTQTSDAHVEMEATPLDEVHGTGQRAHQPSPLPVSTACYVQMQETGPFHQVRLLILMKMSALLVAASAQMQYLDLCTSIDHIVNAQSFMGVLYRHVQHVSTCRAEMHIVVACVALQLQLRDISGQVLSEALAGVASSSHMPPSTGDGAPSLATAAASSTRERLAAAAPPPTFLSQLRGGVFALDGGVQQQQQQHLLFTDGHATNANAAGSSTPVLLADLLHDVGLPLFHLVAADQAAQEGFLYTHPATRLLVRLLQAYATYQAASSSASRLDLPHTAHTHAPAPRAASSDVDEDDKDDEDVRERVAPSWSAGLPTWRPLATTQRQRCATAFHRMLTPLVAAFDQHDTFDDEDEQTTERHVGASWPSAWTPANRVLLLLLRGLWCLTEDRDEFSARRAFKRAAQIAKRSLGMLDGLTADALQWLATAAKLSDSMNTTTSMPMSPSQTRTRQLEIVATQVAMRCSAAALWRVAEARSDEAEDNARVSPAGADCPESGECLDFELVTNDVCAQWRRAVQDVCGADVLVSDDAGSAGGELERSMLAFKRRKLLVAAVTFLPGTASYARLI